MTRLGFLTDDTDPRARDAARDALAQYVVKVMGDPAAVLAVDESGFLKKDRMSGGGRALIDRELYVPEKWTDHRDGRRAVRIGDGVSFATTRAGWPG